MSDDTSERSMITRDDLVTALRGLVHLHLAQVEPGDDTALVLREEGDDRPPQTLDVFIESVLTLVEDLTAGVDLESNAPDHHVGRAIDIKPRTVMKLTKLTADEPGRRRGSVVLLNVVGYTVKQRDLETFANELKRRFEGVGGDPNRIAVVNIPAGLEAMTLGADDDGNPVLTKIDTMTA
jgi:hypothetical protein